MKRLWALSLLLPMILCGCGGKATIVLENHTDVFVHGTTGEEEFSLYAGDHCTRVVEVGGFWSSSSDITTTFYFHETVQASSPVQYKKSRRDEMKKDCRYNVYAEYVFGSYGITTTLVDSESSLLGI